MVADVYKRFLHSGLMPSIYYFRTQDGLEVDLVVDLAQKLHLFEIKNAVTVMPRHGLSLERASTSIEVCSDTSYLISASGSNFTLLRNVLNRDWKYALLGG